MKRLLGVERVPTPPVLGDLLVKQKICMVWAENLLKVFGKLIIKM